MDFKKILNNELKKQNLTFYRLGKMCGLTSRAISYYAKGERTPNIYDADKVLKALGVSVLIGECGDKQCKL